MSEINFESIICPYERVHDAPDLVVEEAVKKVEESYSLRKGYKCTNYNVWKYFSKYRWSSMLHSFVSNVDVYDPSATEEVIAF